MLETKVFKPYNKKLDTEAWPQLELVDAVVYRYVADGPDELCDLLDVQFTGPLRITGTINKIPGRFNKMVKDIGDKPNSTKTAATLARGLHGATITITDVVTYSLESYKNPRTDSTIWALGYAAWYSISPAPQYKKYFDRSLKKAHSWDITLEYGKSSHFKLVTVEQLFARYFQKHPSCESVSGAENIFRNCRKFLACKMLEPIDPLARGKSKSDRARWENFCLWRWLTREYPSVIPDVEKSKQSGKTVGGSSTDKRAFSLNTQHGFDSLEGIALERKLKPHQLTTEWLISITMKKSGATDKAVRPLLQGQAKALSTLMELSRQVNWVQSSLYNDLLLMSKEVSLGNCNNEVAGDCSHDLKVKKNDEPGKGEPTTNTNLRTAKRRLADALNETNDMEQDNYLMTSPNLPQQPPRSAKGKSVLRPIMTPSIQREFGQGSGISSPLSSPPVSPPSTPVTVEQLVAPGPSTLPKRKQISSASNPKESTKRSRVSEGPASKDTSSGDGNDDENWSPLSPGGGRPPIARGSPTSTKPDGTFWHCTVRDCLTIIPNTHIPAGRAIKENHIAEHLLTLKRASNAIEEVTKGSGRSREALLAKIERMAEMWQVTRQQNLSEFDAMKATIIDNERALDAESSAKRELNGKGKEKEKQ